MLGRVLQKGMMKSGLNQLVAWQEMEEEGSWDLARVMLAVV